MEISNSALNKIGEIIRRQNMGVEYDGALKILNDWRETHGRVLDFYYDKCVKLAKNIDQENIIVAQRLKRLPTIINKMNRYRDMGLSRMQDIAGVRIIVEDMEQLKATEEEITKWEGLQRNKDYIENPKKSGYRGKHFVFKKDEKYVEIQLRTQFQHLWATAVETVDVFRGGSLKEGDDNSYWHDFFCQVSSIFAMAEGENVLSEHRNMSMKDICVILRKNIRKHKIFAKIASYAVTGVIIDNKNDNGAYYLVVTLNFKEKRVDVSGYREADYSFAFNDYKDKEQENISYKKTVLVSINQIEKVRDAYPNFFMELGNFLKMINFILEKSTKK